MRIAKTIGRYSACAILIIIASLVWCLTDADAASAASLQKASIATAGEVTYAGAKYEIVDDAKTPHANYICPIKKNKSSYAIPRTIKANYNGKIRKIKVTSISDGAFRKCGKVKTVNCKANIDSIGEKAFFNCKRLVTFKSSAPIKAVYEKAFYGCKKLKTFKSRNNYLSYIGTAAFKGCSSLLSFPKLTATEFKNGKKLKRAQMLINKEAFSGCKKLKSIVIESIPLPYYADGSSSICIDEYAFKNCSALQSIAFKKVNKKAILWIQDYAFYGCKSLKKLYGFENFHSVEVSMDGYVGSPFPIIPFGSGIVMDKYGPFNKDDFKDYDGIQVWFPEDGKWRQVFTDIAKDDPAWVGNRYFKYMDGIGWVNYSDKVLYGLA